MINRLLNLSIFITLLVFSSCSDNDDTSEPVTVVIEGASVKANVGGPNQPNQVYVDLSTNQTLAVKRDTWDLGFYAGDEFRVALNGSIYMATAPLEESDIDAVNSNTQEVKDLQPDVFVGGAGVFSAESINYIDNPNGTISDTAINEIKINDSENAVYLLNLGYKVGTTKPPTGRVSVEGEKRGWMKIQILRRGNDYLLRYADLDATTHNEVTISKSNNYNFTFFSFDTEKIVSVEPEKQLWDINFTVFSNVIPGAGTYGYTDFVTSNIKAGVSIYMVDSEKDNLTYDGFTMANVDNSLFIDNNQTVIGSSWRNGGGPNSLPSIKTNVFYVLSDTDGNLYKMQFLAMTNESGERGYPEFVYALLN